MIIGNALNAVVLAVHHAGKDFSAGMRGSSALNGAADAVWRIEKDAAQRRMITIEKMKDDRDGDIFEFTLERRFCAIDDDGDEITTCVMMIEEVAKPALAQKQPSAAAGPQPISQPRIDVLSAFAAAIDLTEHWHRSTRVSQGTKAIPRDALNAQADALEIAATPPNCLRNSLDRHLRVLEGRGLIGHHRQLIWVVGQVTRAAECQTALKRGSGVLLVQIKRKHSWSRFDFIKNIGIGSDHDVTRFRRLDRENVS